MSVASPIPFSGPEGPPSLVRSLRMVVAPHTPQIAINEGLCDPIDWCISHKSITRLQIQDLQYHTALKDYIEGLFILGSDIGPLQASGLMRDSPEVVLKYGDKVVKVSVRSPCEISAFSISDPNQGYSLICDLYKKGDCSAKKKLLGGDLIVYTEGVFAIKPIEEWEEGDQIVGIHGMDLMEQPETLFELEDLGKVTKRFSFVENELLSLHLNGCVHRDIKLHNMVSSEDGNLQLIDWERAKRIVDKKGVFAGPLRKHPHFSGKDMHTHAYSHPVQKAPFNNFYILDTMGLWLSKYVVLFKCRNTQCPPENRAFQENPKGQNDYSHMGELLGSVRRCLDFLQREKMRVENCFSCLPNYIFKMDKMCLDQFNSWKNPLDEKIAVLEEFYAQGSLIWGRHTAHETRVAQARERYTQQKRSPEVLEEEVKAIYPANMPSFKRHRAQLSKKTLKT